MLELNCVHITGRLVTDPELKYSAGGTAYVRFRIANETGWGDKKKTHFISVTAFGKRAEFIGQHFRKGTAIYVQGELEMNTWEDDGDKKSVLRVIATQDAKFAESKRDADARNERRDDQGASEEESPNARPTNALDDLPF